MELKKEQIRERLVDYCSRLGSQNKAANSLNEVSAGTISQIINNNWSLISDEMWRNIAAQIGHASKEWMIVETRDFKLLTTILEDAQENSIVFAVTGEAGSGKSAAFKTYLEGETQNVYLLQCNEFWNRKLFMMELLSVMGRSSAGFTVGEMMNEIVSALKKAESPLIIMDEADKLSDQVLYFFITLYNHLEDHCGIILAATDHLEKRINRGLRLNKKGYKEIYSRFGRKFIHLSGLTTVDINAVCIANGVTDKAMIKAIIEDCDNDLRRVKRKIHAAKKTNSNN